MVDISTTGMNRLSQKSLYCDPPGTWKNIHPCLASPGDPRGGVTRGGAHQGHVLRLLDHHVLAGLEIINLRGDVHVQTSILLLHLLGVDLTHVAAPVRLQH